MLALLLSVGGCEPSLEPGSTSLPAAPGPSVAAPGPVGSVATSTTVAPTASLPPRPRPPRAREGETSVEALIQRARAALQEVDDAELVRCLVPAARRAWLGDALLAIEIETQVPRYEDAIARRRALGAMRDRVRSHLVDEGPVGRPRELSPDALEGAILERIDDPDLLLAELLGVSRRLGHPLDPVAAASLGRASATGDPARAAPGGPLAPTPPPDRAGLARALRRIERSTELAEVHLVDDQGIALLRGADGGLEPIRLVRRGDTVWIDES